MLPIRLAPALAALVLALPQIAAAQPDHWDATGGPTGGPVSALIIDGGTTYAGTSLGGIFRSEDLGDTWSRLDLTGVFESVNSFLLNADGDLFAGTSFGVRRSTDHGETWELFTVGLPPNPYVSSLAVNSSGVLFAGSTIGGMYRSEDEGETWTEINAGLTNTYVRAVAVAPDGTIYSGTNNGLFMSTDNGDSWSDISEGLPYRSIWSLLVENDGTLWDGSYGLFKMTDDGWSNVNVRTAFSLDTTATGAVVAGLTEVVGVTTDGGETFLERSLEARPFLSVYALATKGDTILAGTKPRGVFRSDDGGRTWEPKHVGFDATEVTDLVVTASGTLIASTRGGPFYSDDHGGSWVRSIEGLGHPNLEGLGALSNGTVLAGTNNDGIYLSTDDGETWSEPASNLVQVGIKSFAEAPNGDLYAGGRNGVIYRSTDEGAGWDSVDVVPDEYEIAGLGVAFNGTVYAGWRGGIRRSADNGTTWEDANSGLPESPDVVDFVFEENGDVLAAAFSGVYRSSDGGDSWELTGNVPFAGLRALARGAQGWLYAAIRGGGVAFSTDEGATWELANTGLENLDATSLALIEFVSKTSGSAANDLVFVGTRGGGVSRLTSAVTSTDDDVPSATRGVQLGANYPNPFNSSTTIPIQLDRPQVVTLTLFDVLGREVGRLDERRLPAGKSTLHLETGHLTPGMYFCQLGVEGRNVRRAIVKGSSP